MFDLMASGMILFHRFSHRCDDNTCGVCGACSWSHSGLPLLGVQTLQEPSTRIRVICGGGLRNGLAVQACLTVVCGDWLAALEVCLPEKFQP